MRTLAQRQPAQCLETVAVVGGGTGRRKGLCYAEQLPALRKFRRTMAVAEKAVIPDAMKPIQRHVDQEASDEFPAAANSPRTPRLARHAAAPEPRAHARNAELKSNRLIN